jgi:catechol 2,3-dioxygenase-like lactoylglutathione lyase family enzyme|tara:strand:+ start:225 stop:623 length:399 start_codon:yes stop_codon:yes gene_type:complete
VKLEKIDHVVITVKDLKKTIDFYTNILGMKLEKFSSSLDDNQFRYAVSFGSQKINIHEEIKPIKPNALNPSSGSMDICFISKNKINDWVHHLVKKGINIEIGPERKTGALGPILSIYIRDPDFNLIEISNQL